ncbi:SDR family NAD(P)-dependent oxidoreductase [Dactylosporangium sp. NPDC048998]|uniref:SDR family NAD(P)-dependent oxidoreductase n=1 Tax=Dactylosporangium sp. NPDC048998 TaxID=3363976 RepID=UPI00371F8F70
MPTTSGTDDYATGRVALITGASRPYGLGVAVARELATHGFHAILAGRDLDETRLRAEEMSVAGFAATAVRIDLSDPATITEAAARLRAEFGRLDALIHNAALMPDWDTFRLLEADADAVHAAFEVCVFGPWALTQACLPLLEAAPAARIVTVSSGAAMQVRAGAALPSPVGAPGYSMAKFTAEALTTSLAVELRDAGILANSVDPGQFASHPELGDDNDGRPTVESARWVAWAAMLPAGGPTGVLFEDGKPVGHGALAD